MGNFPGGPVVKNLLCNEGSTGSMPVQGTKVPQAAEQLSLSAVATEPARCN